MRILLVEDDVEYQQQISKDIGRLNNYARIEVAASKASAMAAINAGFFDLIVLDLKIPTVDGAVDTEPEHGYAIFEYARQNCPGTPIFVLTGSAAEPFIDTLTKNIEQVDLWGAGVLPTARFLPKHVYGRDFETQILPYLNAFASIFDLELNGTVGQLRTQESRVLRIFGMQQRAVKCVVQILSGGLSGTKVLRLKLTDAQGSLIYHAVAKLGSKEEVFDENDRFDQRVSRLDGKATPRKLGLVEYGGGNTFGVFYGLAAGFESNAFEVALKDDDAAERMVKELTVLTRQWSDGVPETRQTVREIRRHSISDEKFARVRGLLEHSWIEEFESKSVQTIRACAHGDMHGFNVLSSGMGDPILIDFGDVGTASGPLDPITLELSFFFHPKGPLRDAAWPSIPQASDWGNLETYLIDCPIPRFIRACRAWAYSRAAGDREIAATVYAYAVRQLKYDGANVRLVNALVTGAKALFDSH